MKDDFFASLPLWLRELNLPEPELSYYVDLTLRGITLDIAFPDARVGLVLECPLAESVNDAGWHIWFCTSPQDAHAALLEMAAQMGIETPVPRLNFDSIELLLDQGLFEQASEELEKLQGSIDVGHPDWELCEKWGAKIVRLRKKQGKERILSAVPEKSFENELVTDYNRMVPLSPLLPPHSFFGFFSPSGISQPGVIDAIWAAKFDLSPEPPWVATAKGHPAAETTSISATETDGILLDKLVQYLGSSTTFVWDAPQSLSTLQVWHYRTKGVSLPSNLAIVDLKALCLVAFPTTRKIDTPESFCFEHNIEFQDSMRNGGPLAAMEELLKACVNQLSALEDSVQAVLRNILSRTRIPKSWLEFLFPKSGHCSLNDYIESLRAHLENLPLPLKRSVGSEKLIQLTIEDFFSANGYLSRVSDQYQVRNGQLNFARKVDQAAKDQRPYLLEAGTGTGKTIAYLVPLLLSNKRCYVATHTKTLQDQAWNKDVPRVLDAFSLAGVERSVAILKGKNNYFCPQSFAHLLDELDEIIASQDDAYVIAAIARWALCTDTGWLSELEGLEYSPLIHLLARDQAPPVLDNKWASSDPHTRARNAANSADLVLVNHSFVFTSAQFQPTDESNVETLLFDEAHAIEDVVTEALTWDFTPWHLQDEILSLLKRDSNGNVQGLLKALVYHRDVDKRPVLKSFRDTIFGFERALSNWCRTCSLQLTKLGSRTEGEEETILFDFDEILSGDLSQHSKDLLAQLGFVIRSLEDLATEIPKLRSLPDRLADSLGSFLDHLRANQQSLGSLLSQEIDRVHWGETTTPEKKETNQPRLLTIDDDWRGVFHSTPLNVANWLKETLPGLYQHRIYVSATLTVGKSFDNLIQRLGLTDDEPVTDIFDSPFDFKRQALLAIPTDMPYPQVSSDSLYLEDLSKFIADLAKIADGCTLVLFTARRTMGEVAPRLQGYLKESDIEVLTQAQGNRTSIVERFRNAPQNGEKLILLGLRAFWEGVDIPGDPLKILVISRLPFDYFEHPVARAKRALYLSEGIDRDFFRDITIPVTFLHLRQMFGRLIRTEDDRGVCVIADPRIYSRRYGRYMLSQLSESRTAIGKRREILDSIQRFLRDEELVTEAVDLNDQPPHSDELSSEQKAIVESPAERIVVRAAAGSGKTRTLIERVLFLLKSGQARPEEMLILTYTRKACEVITQRLEKRLDPANAYLIGNNVLTYHRLAARIVRGDSKSADEKSQFVEEAFSDQRGQLFQEARKAAGLGLADLSDEDAAAVVSYAQNGLINEDELLQAINLTTTDPFIQSLGRFYLAYVNLLREARLLDYGETLVQAVRTLREDATQKQIWSSRFKWILCDEYQDTTPAQAALISLIGQHAKLFVVGDSAQSIYSWQGADPENLSRFQDDFPGTVAFSLSRNYRCFPNLVRVSKHFLLNCEQIHKVDIAYDMRRDSEIQTVYYLENENEREEARNIAALARSALQNVQCSIGVLARKWSLLEAVEIELLRQGIAYEYEGEAARGLLANPQIISIVKRAEQIVRQTELSRPHGDSPEGELIAEVKSGVIDSAGNLLARTQQIMGIKLEHQTYNILERVISELKDKPLQFLRKLLPDNPNSDKDIPRVVLSTIHSQKGEEFDTVIVIGLEKDNMPLTAPRKQWQIGEWRRIVQGLSHTTWRAQLSQQDLQRIYDDEEERICYVAMTRARFNLFLSWAHHREGHVLQQSDFLKKALLPGAITEISSTDQASLEKPVMYQIEDQSSYRSDGRIYLTNSGIAVRSKSEMLLANEFSRWGMHFEYEAHITGISGVLPDFVFPEYGNVVLEHLGLLDDENYRKRWEVKRQKYERQDVPVFETTENDIRNVPETVLRLRAEFREWATKKHGSQRVKMIDLIEAVRRNTSLRIGRTIGDFEAGLFEVEEDPHVLALFISPAQKISSPEQLNTVAFPGFAQAKWKELDIADVIAWVAVTESR